MVQKVLFLSIDFPFEPKKADNFISYASITYVQNAFYLFGGYHSSYELNIIGRMDLDGQWTYAGRLNQSRRGHNIIYDGEYLMVIGGAGDRLTEKCLIEDGSFSCTSQRPKLYKYYAYPELFLVSCIFCKK